VAKRVSIEESTPPVPYEPTVTRFSTGSTLLDLILGGGWAVGRVGNLVGDRSTGKTLCAIEAAAGFHKLFPKGHARYLEAESAFDPAYAASVGLPQDHYSLVQNIDVLEGVFDDVRATIKKYPGQPILYIVDSLDALSTNAEMARDINENALVAAKARVLSEFFRRTVREMSVANCTLLIVNQIRDMIGGTFPVKVKGGGRALNFYLSQEIWLAETAKIERTVHGIKRAIGIEVSVKNKKNKVGAPYREAKMIIMFDYGLDDEISNLGWLKDAKVTELEGIPLKELEDHVKKLRNERNLVELRDISQIIRTKTQQIWMEIEQALQPPVRKQELLS